MRASAALAFGLAILLCAGRADARSHRHRHHHPRHHRRTHQVHRRAHRLHHIDLPKRSTSEDKAAPEGAVQQTSAPALPHGPRRIDFDSRMIQGQTNKQGAIYLYDRKPLVIHSMVETRTSFRKKIYQDAQQGT